MVLPEKKWGKRNNNGCKPHLPHKIGHKLVIESPNFQTDPPNHIKEIPDETQLVICPNSAWQPLCSGARAFQVWSFKSI